MTDLQRRLRGRAAELRLSVKTHRARHGTNTDPSSMRLRGEAIRAAELLDEAARILEGP